MRSLSGPITIVTEAITDAGLCRLTTPAPAVEADADLALPFILSIHRQLTMSGRTVAPLNEAIWRAARSPSHKKGSAILHKLKTIPDTILLTVARMPVSGYRVASGRA